MFIFKELSQVFQFSKTFCNLFSKTGQDYEKLLFSIISFDLLISSKGFTFCEQFSFRLYSFFSSLQFIFFLKDISQIWNIILFSQILETPNKNLFLLFLSRWVDNSFFTQKRLKNKRHYFHILDISPWPLLGSFAAFNMAVGGVMYFHLFKGGLFLLFFGLFSVLLIMFGWWRDVIRESTFGGFHTILVKRGLRIGFVLFIVSEVMFFFAFFWAFFHASLSPSVELGCVWPPVGIVPFNPWEIPLLNTMILLYSGVTVTLVHYAIVVGNSFYTIIGFFCTLILALIFTGFQVYEYSQATFSISDSVYGSTFYLTTGFHGLHVIIGTVFLLVCFLRFFFGHFTKYDHLGFVFAAWYWHFVDVVWLFLFISIYWWGSLQ